MFLRMSAKALAENNVIRIFSNSPTAQFILSTRVKLFLSKKVGHCKSPILQTIFFSFFTY